LDIKTEPNRQPIAKIVTRKKFHCPTCKILLPEGELTSSVINCPACNTRLKMPNAGVEQTGADNKRREKRCPVSLKVKYNTAKEFKIDYTKNVSQGGMLITTESPIETGTKLQLELFIPDLNEPILLTVEVMHNHKHAFDEKHAGVGVRFIDIDPLSKSILKNYLCALTDCS